MKVTFCGHRDGYNRSAVSEWLDVILPALIEGGAETFYLGGYGTFDCLATEAVQRQKADYPYIESVLVIPYLNKTASIFDYDRTTYPPLETVPPRYAILRRNQWMVEESDVVVSGVMYSWGGAAKTLEHAKKKEKVIFQFPVQAKRYPQKSL